MDYMSPYPSLLPVSTLYSSSLLCIIEDRFTYMIHKATTVHPCFTANRYIGLHFLRLVFCDVTSCCWVIGANNSEGPAAFIFRKQKQDISVT